jgi:hypothetical protein
MKDTDDTPPIMSGWDDAEPAKTWKPSTASVWGRVWGRVDITAERFGAPAALQRVGRQWATVEWRDLLDRQARRWWGSPEFCAHHEAEKAAHLDDLVSGPPPPMSRGKLSNPRWLRASQAIEERRFPKLPTLKKVFARPPKSNVASAAERRAELAPLLARYTGEIRYCPPETTSTAMNRRMGRPSLNDRAMTAAERQRRYRQRKRAQG